MRDDQRLWKLGLSVAVLTCTLPLSTTEAQTSPPARDAIAGLYESETTPFRVEVVAEGLQVPWGMAFLPDGTALVSDRPAGRLYLLHLATGTLTPVETLPDVYHGEEGESSGGSGMLDVILHPGYAQNGWIYFSYSILMDGGKTVVVDRARLHGARLTDRARLFTAQAHFDTNFHFGGRLVLQGGYLYMTVGDRRNRDRAQDLDSHIGKVIRLHEDGRVPEDNPFVDQQGALPEIWSYGHRNPQGLALHPETGTLWEHEHGPQGGDEINVIRPGLNYGWPLVSHGEEYGGGPIGEGQAEQEGIEPPLYYYVPSIAPSGMTFYTGEAFPLWRGNLFLGALALTHLNRLVLDDGRVVHEERLFDDQPWRIRFARQGPDGFLYIGIDEGMILRLRPS